MGEVLIITGLILVGLSAVCIAIAVLGVIFIKPRFPEWWRNNIADINPYEK